MAGVGFILRKLMRQDNISGMLRAFVYAALCTSGPWILTVMGFAVITVSLQKYIALQSYENFRTILLYNFCFSFVFTAPVINISTRYLSDKIYEGDLRPGVGVLLSSLIAYYLIFGPLATLFYFLYVDIPVDISIMAVTNFLLISGIWISGVFISTLKYYRAVILSFTLGITVAVYFTVALASPESSFWMFLGFNTGIGVILASLIALVLVEYPPVIRDIVAYFKSYKFYWKLALGGITYSTGAWIDKWIMWGSPDAYVSANNLATCPLYDIPMFCAYISVVPTMAVFMLVYETSFFVDYVRYYKGILEHVNLYQIDVNYRRLMKTLYYQSRNLIIVQGVVTIVLLIMATSIFSSLPGLKVLQVGIFRLGLLGAALNTFTLFLVIIFYYFDERNLSLRIQLTNLVLNGLFTYMLLPFGYVYYGTGFLLSNIVTFAYAAFALKRFLDELTFHSFVTNNSALQN